MRVDPATVFPFLLVVVAAVVARWWPARRDVAQAGYHDAQSWDLLIENLREEVEWVRQERDADRDEHRRVIAELRREHAVEQDRLRTQVLELKQEVARLRRAR